MSTLPGGPVSNRPLHFFWLADGSGSMSEGGKIQSLNTAIKNAIPEMRKVAAKNPFAQVLVRAIKFSDYAQWLIPNPTPLEELQWNDISASGRTAMGAAFSMLAEQLKIPPMTERSHRPVIALISDGLPTDDVNHGINEILRLPWGRKAVRLAIGIGKDADYPVLRKFIANPEIEPLRADNAELLAQEIRWASTCALGYAPVIPGMKRLPAPREITPSDDPDCGVEIISENDVW